MCQKSRIFTAIPEEAIVNDILDPISNKTRLQILKALYYETKDLLGPFRAYRAKSG